MKSFTIGQSEKADTPASGLTSSSAGLTEDVRAGLIEAPEIILDDRDVMRALIAANERAMGHNIVDLRGIAMQRLEARLDRLEDTHRSVIAAAYENLAGTNQIHRAILKMLEPTGFEDFLANLGSEVADILRVEAVRLVLESREAHLEEQALARFGQLLSVAPTGFVDDYMEGGRAAGRTVVLRRTSHATPAVYGPAAETIRSEAVLRLDLGPGRLPGMIALGSADPHLFRSNQGTDLLSFFGGVFERMMRRWLG